MEWQSHDPRAPRGAGPSEADRTKVLLDAAVDDLLSAAAAMHRIVKAESVPAHEMASLTKVYAALDKEVVKDEN